MEKSYNNAKEYCILVILYKTSVQDCTSIQSLLRCAQYLLNSTIVVWDNSPKHLEQDELDLLNQGFKDIFYIHTPENSSLSKIYNSIIERFACYSFYVFLDQDSCFDEQYFQEINEVRNNHPDINLYVPKIFHEKKLLSPGYYYSFKSSYRKDINAGINSTKNLCIITSGMCVSSHYLRDSFQGFDEGLTFYGIDTYFAIQFRKANQLFYVLASTFNHSVSLNEREPYEIKWARFKNHRAAMLKLTKKTNFFIVLLGRLYVIYLTIRFKIQHLSMKNGSSHC